MKTKNDSPTGGFLRIVYKNIKKKQLITQPAKQRISVIDILNAKNR